jgi:protein-L-isoaspartate(D-aspartate) O-methyltransferase
MHQFLWVLANAALDFLFHLVYFFTRIQVKSMRVKIKKTSHINQGNSGSAFLLLFMILLMSSLLCAFCDKKTGVNEEKSSLAQKDMHQDRERMVIILRAYGIKDKAVLAAMAKVRRHMYIPMRYRWRCNPYGDYPCPIGYAQTISQPYIVAYMTEQMNVKTGEKVLEIGTGSGYQAAILAELGAEVCSIEIVRELAEHAKKVLKDEGYGKVKVLRGDGYKGWPEQAPFDVIIVTCAPEKVPKKLVEQLKEGGRMILPVGKYFQRLVILRKKKGKVIRENDLSVRFVPMVHEK